MGTIIIGTIVDRARTTLLETGVSDIRWTRTGELLNHANSAIREIVATKPDAYVLNASFSLATGAKQTIPAAGTQFFGVQHNLGVDGLTPGIAVIAADRTALSRANRSWMTTTGAAVEHFVHDERDPKVFYVYPRPSGTWHINLVYAAIPTPIAAANIDSGSLGLLPLDDVYSEPVADYIVGYALLKNMKAGDTNKASYFLTKFYSFLGKRFDAMVAFAPADPDAAEKMDGGLGKP